MDTYTNGPWLCRPTAGHDTHGQSAVYSETDGKTIALVYDGDKHGALLAAAPDLAEALRVAVCDLSCCVARVIARTTPEEYEVMHKHIRRAKEALGKAGVE